MINKGMAVSTGQFGTLIGFNAHQGGVVKKTGREQVVYCHQGWGSIMLILTRRAGEKIVVGEDVTVTVLSVKGNQVRIGIDAPRDVAVNRDEIYQRILKEREALNGDDGPVSTAQNPIRMPSPSDKR